MIILTYSQQMADTVMARLKEIDTGEEPIVVSMLAKIDSVSVFAMVPNDSRRCMTIECVPLVNKFKVNIGFREEFAENGEPLSAWGFEMFAESEIEEALEFGLKWLRYGLVPGELKSTREKDQEASLQRLSQKLPKRRRNNRILKILKEITDKKVKPSRYHDEILNWINPHVRVAHDNARRMQRLVRNGYKFSFARPPTRAIPGSIFIPKVRYWTLLIELPSQEFMTLYYPFFPSDIEALAKYDKTLVPANVRDENYLFLKGKQQ